MTKNTATCPICKGKGATYDIVCNYWEECEVCGGEGTIELEEGEEDD